MLRLFGVLCIIAAVPAYSVGMALVADAATSEVGFSISIDKAVFVEGEPIIVTCAVKNKSKDAASLAEPMESYGAVRFDIHRVGDDIPLPAMEQYTRSGAPSDFGSAFRPQETRTISYDLQSFYDADLPVGQYAVSATYTGLEEVPGIWHGIIKTGEVRFTVECPSESIRDIAMKFRKARRQAFGRRSEATAAVGTLQSITGSATAGAFAPYAAFYLAVARGGAVDRQGSIKALLDYARDHRDVPYYGTLALRMAGEAMYQQGNYEDARSAFLQLPDGFERRDWIRSCERKLSKR